MAREDGFFDDLARGLADGTLTRGKALRLMGAAVVGGALGSLGIGEASADPIGCKRNGKRCTRGTQCCSGNCSGGTCRAQTTTSTTTTMCIPNDTSCNADTQCCSGMCNQETGECDCIPTDSTCNGNAGCCSGTCNPTSGTCADSSCPSGKVLLSNGTCAIPCTGENSAQDCAGGCDVGCYPSADSSSPGESGYCGSGVGSSTTCTSNDECPTGEFCNGFPTLGGVCVPAC
jgi:hypothetical protein